MSFLIARCGTFTIGNGLIERMDLKEGEKTQPHLQHSPDTRMCQDLPLLPERERRAFPSFRLAAAGLVSRMSACEKPSIAFDCVLGSRHRDVAAGDCQLGWLQGIRNLLRRNGFWLQRPDTYRIDSLLSIAFRSELVHCRA